MNFGIKAGLNIANMYDDIDGTESKIGFCGGGFVTFGLGNLVVVQPEVMYTQKGVEGGPGHPGTLNIIYNTILNGLLFFSILYG